MPNSLTASLSFPCDLDDRGAVRELAHSHGVTMADALRRLLDLGLHDPPTRRKWERALSRQSAESAS